MTEATSIIVTRQDAEALLELAGIVEEEGQGPGIDGLRLIVKFRDALNLKEKDLGRFYQIIREFECSRHQMAAIKRYGLLRCKLCGREERTPKLSSNRFVVSEEAKLKLWAIASAIAPHLGFEPQFGRCGFNLSWQDNDPRFSVVYGNSSFRLKLSNRGALVFVREAGGEMTIRRNHKPEKLAKSVKRWLMRLARK